MSPETAEQREQRQNLVGLTAIRVGELLSDLRVAPDRETAGVLCLANHPAGCFLIELKIIRWPPDA